MCSILCINMSTRDWCCIELDKIKCANVVHPTHSTKIMNYCFCTFYCTNVWDVDTHHYVVYDIDLSCMMG